MLSPTCKRDFSDENNDIMIAIVNRFQLDVLFVVMTAPKKEKSSHKKNVYQDDFAIGAVFDFYAGTVKRPSQFWIDLKFEWFVRLVKEPKRMWRRYLYYGPFFYISITESFF